MTKKLTGNIVKDNPREAAKLSPTYGRFKHTQPSPQAKSIGVQKRNMRLRMQALIESQLDELLENPNIRKQDVEVIIAGFSKTSTITDIFFNKMLRAITDNKSDANKIAHLMETMSKLGYGDKIDVSGEITGTANITDRLDAVIKKLDDRQNTH